MLLIYNTWKAPSIEFYLHLCLFYYKLRLLKVFSGYVNAHSEVIALNILYLFSKSQGAFTLDM